MEWLETRQASAFERHQSNHGHNRAFSAQETLSACGIDPSRPELLREQFGANFASELAALARIPDPAFFGTSLLNFAQRLQQAGRSEQAALLLARISQVAALSSDVKTQAGREADALAGRASNGLRAEFLISHLAKEATDYRSIVPMLAGSLAGQAVSTAFLGRMAGSAPAWLTRGAAARALAGLGGLGAELPIFVSASRLLSGAAHGSWGEDFQKAALTLGALRVFGAGVPSVLGSNAPSFLKNGAPLLANFGGVAAARILQGQLGLAPRVDGSVLLTDTLAGMLSLTVGAHLGKSLLGPRFAALQSEMALRTQDGFKAEAPTSPLNLSEAFAASGSPRATRALVGQDHSGKPAPLMMSTDGKSDGPSGGKTFLGMLPPGIKGGPPSGGSDGGTPMEESYSIAGALVKEKLGAEERAKLENLGQKDLIVVQGSYDNIGLVLKSMGLPFTQVPPQQVSPALLKGAQFVFVNCIADAPDYVTGLLGSFVQAGGLLMTTDWALTGVIEKAFRDDRGTPLYVRHNGRRTGEKKMPGERHELVGITDFKKDDPAIAGYWANGEPQWWLEPSSYPIQIMDPSKVEVLARSEELGKRYGADPVIVRFKHGKGGVIHMISHFYLQHGGAKAGTADVDAGTYATSMGVSQDLLERINRTKDKTNVTGGTIHAATSSIGFVANTITSYAGWSTGAVPPQPDQSAVPKVSGVFDVKVHEPTAVAANPKAGEEPAVGTKPPLPAQSPEDLPWKPDPKKPEEWAFEDGRWVFKMPAEKTETMIGRQGDTVIVDPRNPPYVSRFHARIRKVGSGEGQYYVIIAQKKDVIVQRGELRMVLEGSRHDNAPGNEGFSMALLPGDEVTLAPGVSFIFRPQ